MGDEIWPGRRILRAKYFGSELVDETDLDEARQRRENMARKNNGGPPTPEEQVREFIEDAVELFPEVQRGDLEEADKIEEESDEDKGDKA